MKTNLITKKYTTCIRCNGIIVFRYRGLRDRLDTVRNAYSICECQDCGITFTNPFPVDHLEVMYPNLYLSTREIHKKKKVSLEERYRNDQYRFDFSLFSTTIRKQLADISSYLDIGCGTGERIQYVEKQGCKRVFGIDFSDNYTIVLPKKHYFKKTAILDYIPKNKFECVSLFHVIEHLSEPEKILSHIYNNVLADNGYLIIQVPNYNSIERRFFKNKWFCFDVPRHIWHFSPITLSNLLVKNGFTVKSIYQKNAFFHPVSINASVYKDLDIQRIWVKLSKPSLSRYASYWHIMKLGWVITTFATIPISLLANIFSRGSMLTIICVKR
ncbi:class I SAM-dependent methyltransferase [Candidatus Roizmanbacteria bacterium]|nr:class I SAM-dependent methyltransferase [Candidatus Roizmanbacteria bacterium]